MNTNSCPNIGELFEGQTIFITGGTGFIGKVLLEKLLRSCHGVKRIYLAMRPKKGVEIEQRWNKFSSVPLFDRLKKERPDALKKVYVMNADMKEPDLGLSEEDRQMQRRKRRKCEPDVEKTLRLADAQTWTLINEVNFVFHVAATVQFVDDVVDTITQNARSTYILCELSKHMKNIKVFVHTSTAYANYYRSESEWDEKLYPAVVDWKTVLKLLETEPETLSFLQEKILMGHPNPYTYSKSLAEEIVDSYRNDFHTVIVRPSVVLPTYKDPFPGWTDSLNGMAAFCRANALGILRVAWHSVEAYQDYVPVDTVAKSLIILAWCTYYKIKTLEKMLTITSYSLIGWISYRLLDPMPAISNFFDLLS